MAAVMRPPPKSSRSEQNDSKFRFLAPKDFGSADPKLQKHFAAFHQYLAEAVKKFNVNWSKEDLHYNVRLEDFDMVRTLGIGGFGRVMLASCLEPGGRAFYAVKIMDKHNVVKFKQVEHVIQELRILEAVSFPFLINLVYYFKNNCYLFCVLPLIAGGEMFSLLSKEGHFSESAGKVYAAQVVLAFEYLHANGVIYRDLKPENILIDPEGFLKLTDYGFCKKINDKRTWTLCGTPEYLAPEVILSQGYNFSVDWWTLGILIFEMISGHTPFYALEPMKLYGLIVNGKYRMPDKFSRPLQNLIQNLIQTDRDKRFGVLKNGVRDIKTHEWFRDLDWQMVLSKRVNPPHIPVIPASPLENTNFDSYKEEPLRECSTEEYPKEFRTIAIRQTPHNRRR